jgi:hypothetical protein
MTRRKAIAKLTFYRRASVTMTGVTVTECSVCVWDVVCWCGSYLEREHCSAPDLIRVHARFHHSVPRIVEAKL